jgi:hypothetical protein
VPVRRPERLPGWRNVRKDGGQWLELCVRVHACYEYSFGQQMCVKEQHIFNETIPYFDGKMLFLYLSNILLVFRTV